MLKNLLLAILLYQPFPEGRAKIHSVMEIFGMDEDIGVEQIFHQIANPNALPSPSNAACFFTLPACDMHRERVSDPLRCRPLMRGQSDGSRERSVSDKNSRRMFSRIIWRSRATSSL